MKWRPTKSSAPGRAITARLVALACALACLLAASGASAAAPMCDEQAQTIDAPLPIFPSRNQELAPRVRCERPALQALLGVVPAPENGSSFGSTPALERGLPLSERWPPDTFSRQPVDGSEADLGRPGFQSSVYRPPRP